MNSTPWLVCGSHRAFRMRLYCFPYAGGSAASFAAWQALIDPAIEVCAIQLPGRGARLGEPLCSAWHALIENLSRVITRQGERPFAFFGHSLGGLIAFELARHRERLGLSTPDHLFVSACAAPQHRNPSRDLHLLEDDQLIALLEDYNGTPPEVLRNRELMALVLPAVRADLALAEGYQYHPASPLSVPVTAFAGQQDAISVAQVDGWRKETVNEFQARWFEGGHFFIKTQQKEVLNAIGDVQVGTQCA